MGKSPQNWWVQNLVPLTGAATTLLAASAAYVLLGSIGQYMAQGNGGEGFGFKMPPPASLLGIALNGTAYLAASTALLCAVFLWAILLPPERPGKALLSSLGLVLVAAFAVFWTLTVGSFAHMAILGQTLEDYARAQRQQQPRQSQ
jgi:hypothetical protein